MGSDAKEPPAPDDRERPDLAAANNKDVQKWLRWFRGETWFLEAPLGPSRLRRIPIEPLPFRVGRNFGLELVLSSGTISKLHAEIYELDGFLRIRDLGSKNGTFVNRTAAGDAPLCEGDVVHFADYEFRLGKGNNETESESADAEPLSADEATATMGIALPELPHHFRPGTKELRQMIRKGAVTIALQPIVEMQTGAIVAYEVLGRGRHPSLPESPSELFHIAETIGAEGELSRLFRRKAVELLAHRTDLPILFLNTHSCELAQPGLVESLAELRQTAHNLDLALEIHESVLARPAALNALRTVLAEMNISLAYDDFGAGQARLLELAEAPPHYLKFDRSLVQGIDQAPGARRRLLASLVALARDQRVTTLAEGIETAGEAATCRDLGFEIAQGYHFGRPKALDQA